MKKYLRNAICYIIAVPTPIHKNRKPNLNMIIEASKLVGKFLNKGDYVIYESTIFPGLTEEICVPILQKYSNLKCKQNFKIGYSPERINTEDKYHKLNNITKVVSSIDKNSLNEIYKLYSLIVKKVYKAKSIKIAEASKIVENTQRDVNIAFINEITILLNKMGIASRDVLKAAKTKWNFINFKPGLVGGHCKEIDPYYLIDKAKGYNFSPKLIKTSRNINENMASYIADKTCSILNEQGKHIKECKILILGHCFKENVNDFRNSKVENLAKTLMQSF